MSEAVAASAVAGSRTPSADYAGRNCGGNQPVQVVAAMVVEIRVRHGLVDLFCSNAGVGDCDHDRQNAAASPDAVWQRARDVYVMAVVLLAQLAAILPRRPAECLPFLGKPVSAMIHARIGPCRSIRGRTQSRTRLITASSDHGAYPTKCSRDWCLAATRGSAVTAASGSTLLRSIGIKSPRH